jgi:hypothetical protein
MCILSSLSFLKLETSQIDSAGDVLVMYADGQSNGDGIREFYVTYITSAQGVTCD